jgi:hypothetical protein
VYDEAVALQIAEARERRGDGDLAALLAGGDSWEIA